MKWLRKHKLTKKQSNKKQSTQSKTFWKTHNKTTTKTKPTLELLFLMLWFCSLKCSYCFHIFLFSVVYFFVWFVFLLYVFLYLFFLVYFSLILGVPLLFYLFLCLFFFLLCYCLLFSHVFFYYICIYIYICFACLMDFFKHTYSIFFVLSLFPRFWRTYRVGFFFFEKKRENWRVSVGKNVGIESWTETKCNNDLTATWEIMVYVRGIIPFYGRKIQVNVKYYNLPRYIIYLHNKICIYLYIWTFPEMGVLWITTGLTTQRQRCTPYAFFQCVALTTTPQVSGPKVHEVKDKPSGWWTRQLDSQVPL
jgi:hypothetical protein